VGHIFLKQIRKMYGSKIQVYNGTKTRTASGLTKDKLTKNKRGKIVSKKASNAAKRKSNLKGFLIRPRSTRVRRKPKY
jgi:hypothetical protein